MRYRTRRCRSARTIVTDIPLTPLIDTALTLLVIFMVASPMMHTNICVQLPKGSVQEASPAKEQELAITIDKQGVMSFNGKNFATKELGALVQEVSKVIAGKDDQTAYVYADSAVAYGLVMDVVDYLKMADGVRYVVLPTEKRAA